MLRLFKISILLIASFLILFPNFSSAEEITLSVNVRERRATDTINDFDYNQINLSSMEKIYI